MSTEGLRCDVCGGVWQPASSEERCPFCEISRLLAIIDKHPQLGDGMPVAQPQLVKPAERKSDDPR